MNPLRYVFSSYFSMDIFERFFNHVESFSMCVGLYVDQGKVYTVYDIILSNQISEGMKKDVLQMHTLLLKA